MIFVIGGMGFVGGYVVYVLCGVGKLVCCFVRSWCKVGMLEVFGCELVEGDMIDLVSVWCVFEGVDVVVYFVVIW